MPRVNEKTNFEDDIVWEEVLDSETSWPSISEQVKSGDILQDLLLPKKDQKEGCEVICGNCQSSSVKRVFLVPRSIAASLLNLTNTEENSEAADNKDEAATPNAQTVDLLEEEDFDRPVPIDNERQIKRVIEEPESGKLFCTRCRFSTHSGVELRQHEGKHEPRGIEDNRRYKCEWCDYSTNRPDLAKMHNWRHRRIKPFFCSKCQYKFVSRKCLKEHLRTHTGERPYKCSDCDYSGNSAGALKKHWANMHAVFKPYSCTKCDYSTSYRRELVIHTRRHTGEKPFSCHLCDFKSARKTQINLHLRTAHLKEKRYKCPQCDYKSIFKYRVQIHIRNHTGEKPHKCELCDYKTRVKHLLTAHIDRHHLASEDKHLKCSECDFATSLPSIFKPHLLTHTKPFSCPHCIFRTAAKKTLDSHIKLHFG